MMSKNYVLTSILMYFHQKSKCGATLLTPPPLPLGFTAITEQLRVAKVLLGGGPQSGMASVRITISFWFQVAWSLQGYRFSVKPTLS
jgi:hypothetical protein